jgi:hypothetical protein
MILQISIIHDLMHKTGSVLHAGSIRLRVGTIQGQMKMEIGIFLFQVPEIFKEKGLAE